MNYCYLVVGMVVSLYRFVVRRAVKRVGVYHYCTVSQFMGVYKNCFVDYLQPEQQAE